RSVEGATKTDADCRALAGEALDADRPAETFAQAAHDRQAHALARVAVRFSAIERVEDALQHVGGDADAGVGHDHAVGLDPDLDASALGAGAGVGQQVAQHHREYA